MGKTVYLTFPIVMLQDAKHSIQSKLDGVFNYCLFDTVIRTGETPQHAAKLLGITFGNIKMSMSDGEILHNSIPSASPKTSINSEIIFDFYKNSKTGFEVDCFLFFAGVRSILQRKAYAKVTNAFIITRMAGNAKVDEPLPEWTAKYQQRYHMDKMKTELQLNWGLKLYSNHVRGNYISFSLELSELVYQAELKRKKYREKKLSADKQQAAEQARSMLYANSTHTAPIERT